MAKQKGLSDFDSALLILVCTARSGGITAYEIAELMKRGRGGLLGRSPASMYARLPQLAKRGFLDAEPVPSKRRKGAVRYVTTDTGNRAVQEWLGSHEGRVPRFDDSDAYVFLRGMLVETPKVIWKGLRPMVFEIAVRQAELDAYKRSLRERGALESFAARLEVSYSRHLLNAYGHWLDDVRDEFGEDDPLLDD